MPLRLMPTDGRPDFGHFGLTEDGAAPDPQTASGWRNPQDIIDEAIDEATDQGRDAVDDAVDDAVGGDASDILNRDGSVNWAAAARLVLKDIEVVSTVSPAFKLTAADMLSGRQPRPRDEKEGNALRTYKPTLIIRLKQGLGTKVIAPGGRATGEEWKSLLPWLGLGLAGAAAVGLLVFGAGYFVGKRRRS